MRRACPRQIGEALIKSNQSLFTQDVTMERLHNAHKLVLAALQVTHPSLSLFTFGSAVVYGFHEAHSDVDFVALSQEEIADGRGGDSSTQLAKAQQSDLLGKLTKTLKRDHFAWHVDEVKRARVPVIRIKSPFGEFDVTAHRRNGVRNSALLQKYFSQEPNTRWLSMAIKAWSKRTKMNGPMVGYLTSYGFNIMVIHYLIQRGVFKFVNPTICDVATISPTPTYLPLDPSPDPTILGERVLDFLEYYLEEYNMEEHAISLSREGITTKESLGWTRTAEDQKLMSQEKVAYRLCIEDPYEVNLNVGRNVTAFKLDMMRKHFEMARETGLLLLQQNP